MRKFPFYILLTFLFSLVLASCGGGVDTKRSSEIIEHDYFLKVNVWYEYGKEKKILSTNYHKGVMLKVGEKFKITDLSGKSIVFSNQKGVEYAIIHHRKHNPISLVELFDRYFSKTNVTASGGEFTKFTNKEQKNIRKGVVVKGMSKDAVIMSYGYPPGHRTPTLESDGWVYWPSRWKSKTAIFEKGKVVSYQ